MNFFQEIYTYIYIFYYISDISSVNTFAYECFHQYAHAILFFFFRPDRVLHQFHNRSPDPEKFHGETPARGTNSLQFLTSIEFIKRYFNPSFESNRR